MPRVHCGLAVCLSLLSLAAVAADRGPHADRPDRVALSADMSLEQIEQALAAYPPDWSTGRQRTQIAAAFDKLVRVQVRDGMTAEERAALAPLAEMYRRCVDRGLAALEQTPVRDGVLLVKFYSSSLVLKSRAGTVAIDFCQGPINNGGEPEQRDTRQTGFYLTPPQRDRLAKLIDVSLITHRHHDHADYSLARRLVAGHTPVVGPAQLKETWPDLASGLTTPDFGQTQRIGPVTLYTMQGCQYARNAAGDDGQRTGIATNTRNDSETVVYLARVGGLVFLQAAENHAPADAWLRKACQLGFTPNVVFSSGQFQGQRSVDAVLATLPDCFYVPLHEYELTHDNGGNRTSPRYSGTAGNRFERSKAMPLFWGDSFLLTTDLAAVEPAR